MPGSGAGQRLIQGGLGHADGERPHARAEQIQRAHGHPKSLIHLAEHVVGGNLRAVQLEPPDGVGRQQLQRLAGDSCGVSWEDERCHSPRLGPLGGSGEEHVEIGVRGVGDPGLHPGQAVGVTFPFGSQLDGRGVRTMLRFAEGEGRHRLPAGHRRDPPLHQLVAARLEDRISAQALHGEGRLGLGGALGQSFAEQADLHRGDVAGCVAPGALGEQPRQEPVRRQRFHQRAVHPPRLARRGDRGQDLASQGSRFLHEGALLVGKGEVQAGHGWRIPRVDGPRTPNGRKE